MAKSRIKRSYPCVSVSAGLYKRIRAFSLKSGASCTQIVELAVDDVKLPVPDCDP